MNNIQIIITSIGEFFGLVILIKALLDFKKANNELDEKDEEEFVDEKYKKKVKKFIIYCIVGSAIFSISMIVGVFFKFTNNS